MPKLQKLKQFRLQTGLKIQMLALVVAVTALTGGTIGWFLLRQEIRNIRLELERKGLMLTQVLATVTEAKVLLEDVKNLEADIKGVHSDPDVVYAAVFNREGQKLVGFQKVPDLDFENGQIESLLALEAPDLVRSRLPERGADPDSDKPQTAAGDFLIVTAPVRWKLPVRRNDDEMSLFELDAPHEPGAAKMETIGLIRLALSLENSQRYIRARRISVALLTAFICLLGIGAGTLIVHKLMRPIKTLTEGIRRLSLGEMDHRVEIDSANEIGQVAAAFNVMAGELQISRYSIEEHSRDLEKKVEARTREIDYFRRYNENIVSNVPSALVVLDIKRRVLSANPAFFDVFPDFESVDGLTLGDLPFGDRLAPGIQRMLELDAPLRRKEVELESNPQRAPGKTIQVSAVLMAPRDSIKPDDDGRPCILLVVDDITRRKESEQIIHLKTEDLENAYEKLKQMNELNLEILEDSLLKMDELRNAYERLKELDRMKDNFIASISHEFRTPLTAIKAITENLIDIDDVDRAEQLEFLAIVNSECDRLTRLIEEILDLSKIESGKVRWRLSESRIQSIIDKVRSALEQTAQAKGLRLSSVVDPHLEPVIIDEDRIIQVLTNLVSNAVKFTDSGGEIAILADPVEHDGPVTDEQQGLVVHDEVLLVEVRDTGRGISSNELSKVFDRFSQVGSVLKGKPKGTGLGLSIVKEIIERHGGRVWVESRLGQGSSFFFTLRRTPPAPGRLSDADAEIQVME